MKVRIVVVEADEVSPADLAAVIELGMRGKAIAAATSTPRIAEFAAPIAAPLGLTDQKLARIAEAVPEKLAPGTKHAPRKWKPRLARISKPVNPAAEAQDDNETPPDVGPRPVRERSFQCHGCGAEPPGDKQYQRKPRVPCAKCGGMTWEEIPSKGREREAIIS